MSSAKKKNEGICSKCLKVTDCEYKASSSDLVLLRCLDFVDKNTEENKE